MSLSRSALSQRSCALFACAGPVTALVWTGRLLVSASFDQTIRLHALPAPLTEMALRQQPYCACARDWQSLNHSRRAVQLICVLVCDTCLHVCMCKHCVENMCRAPQRAVRLGAARPPRRHLGAEVSAFAAVSVFRCAMRESPFALVFCSRRGLADRSPISFIGHHCASVGHARR